MHKSKFSEEQIIATLAEQERYMSTAEVCRRHGSARRRFTSGRPSSAGWTGLMPGG
jgi:putative transposase